jgi:HAD superfamily hydrolase (TIGR01484 family)
VRPIAELGEAEACGLDGLVFDLDDTVLDGGALTLGAYEALFQLEKSGLRLVACTGRPSGWGEVIARQWPVRAVVVENGAFAWLRDATGNAVRVASTDRLDRFARAARRAELLALAHELVAAHPETALADDNDARRSDVTLDVGEHRSVPRDIVLEIEKAARARGVRTFVSSVHLHLASEADDKASGAIRLIGELFGEDATRARRRYAYAGDSGNDAAAFAAFATTFGVANVREHLREITMPPRYVSEHPRGAGFREIAEKLAKLRARGALLDRGSPAR